MGTKGVFLVSSPVSVGVKSNRSYQLVQQDGLFQLLANDDCHST